jgi:alkylhydroperoxidase family enzyme
VHLLGPDSVLPKRDRELAIIRTAWLCLAPFEWGEHVGLAKQFGVSELEVEQVIVGASDPRWNDHDRALMRAAEELREHALISEETWTQLSQRFDDHQMVELLVLIGHFASVAAFQNTLRLRLESYNPGFAAR